MGSRIIEGGVALAAALSVGMLGVLLAAPWLAELANVPPPSPSAMAMPSAAPGAIPPPLGLYRSRDPLSFGPCFAIELEARSFPVGEDAAPGMASVLWWERGLTGCATRSGEVGTVDADVTRLLSEGDPDGPVGYSLAFALPLPDQDMEVDVEVAILPITEPDPSLLQAVEVASAGFGLVLDRVGEVNPPLQPISDG